MKFDFKKGNWSDYVIFVALTGFAVLISFFVVRLCSNFYFCNSSFSAIVNINRDPAIPQLILSAQEEFNSNLTIESLLNEKMGNDGNLNAERQAGFATLMTVANSLSRLGLTPSAMAWSFWVEVETIESRIGAPTGMTETFLKTYPGTIVILFFENLNGDIHILHKDSDGITRLADVKANY